MISPVLKAPNFISIVSSILLALLATRHVQQVACNSGHTSAGAQLWLHREDLPAQPGERLAELLARVGPNIRASSNYHDYTDIKLNESVEGWRLLREQTQRFAANQVEFYRPRLKKLLKSANVSQGCLNSIDATLDSIERLDSWAVKMWNFNGNFPPTGLFDGQFTDLGSYRGCVDLEVPGNATDANSTQNDYANYCVVAFRPIVPSRRRFHQIYQKEQPEFLGIFNETDIFASALQFGQYFHYLYMKTGVCLSSRCSPDDVQLVAKSIGRQLALMPGPVKCFTRSVALATAPPEPKDQETLFGTIENEPILVNLNAKMNKKQLVSLTIVGVFFGLVFLATTWHSLELLWIKFSQGQDIQYDDDNDDNDDDDDDCNGREATTRPSSIYTKSTETNRVKHIAFHYFSMLTNGEEFFQTRSSRTNEIKCLHGLRAITMSWIICVHTLQYNEWSEFTRVFENVASLQNPVLHPLLNANYAVDNFFLMSGLLAAYTNWSSRKMEQYHQPGGAGTFSVWTSAIARYLRLTPQVLLMSLLYILIPLAGDGPFWFDMTHYESKYCEKNWWVNLLHLQAFYRDNEMCNLVSWWISVDMFYYVLALALLWLIFNRRKRMALLASVTYVCYCTAVLSYRHYTGGYTPNNLGTVPQVGEVWTWFVINFSWSPYDHAYVFFLGFWLGYMLALNKWRQQVRRWARFGWILSGLSMIAINFSSHVWMSGAVPLDNQTVATAYNVVCQVAWANAFAWLIAACHYGCLPRLNRFLSTNLAVIVSKASFIVYLSHMLIVRSVYGSRYHVLEVSVMTVTLLMLGNVVISTGLGVFLAIAFEGPCMKFQRYVISSIKSSGSTQTRESDSKMKNGKEASFGAILLQ